MMTNRLAALSIVSLAACASSSHSLAPLAPAPAPAPAAAPAAPAADAADDARPTSDIAFSVELTVDKSATTTACKLRGRLQHGSDDSSAFITTGATVDDTGDGAARDCMEAVFEQVVERDVTHAPKSATPATPATPAEPVATVDGYDFKDEVFATPGPSSVVPAPVVRHNWRNKGAIHTALRENADQLAACAPRAVAGTVTVQFTIGQGGSVLAADAITHVDPAIDECVVGVIRGIEFPPSDRVTQVNYPVAYRIGG